MAEAKEEEKENNLMQDATNPLLEFKDYKAFAFDDPVEMLYTIDETFRTGQRNLHLWQIEELYRLAGKTATGQRQYTYTKASPLKYQLCACNGSGKDAFIIAPFVVWKLLCSIRCRIVVTSSSYQQLSTQTEVYIRQLAAQVNKYFNETIINYKKEHVNATNTGSEVILFCTDDAGRAEGYHPWPDYVNAELIIITNESKTVPDEIFAALRRCTGYNIWIEVSSPGKISGHFYLTHKRARLYPDKFNPLKWYARRVTAYECPHISKSEIEDAKIELINNPALFRSIYLAEFTSVDETTILTQEDLNKCLESKIPRIVLPGSRRAGLDLSRGIAETVFYVCNHNKVLGMEIAKISDITALSNIIISWIHKWNIEPDNVFADDGGIGAGIIDILWQHNYMVTRIQNNSPAINKMRYGNRGAEIWTNFVKLIQQKLFDLSNIDEITKEQLTTRYYNQSAALGRITLESKDEARRKGRPSPDRADALILANCRLTTEDFKAGKIVDLDDVDSRDLLSPNAYRFWLENKRYSEYYGSDNVKEQKLLNYADIQADLIER